MYSLKDGTNAVEAQLLRFHRWFFDDDEWGCYDYVELYGYLVLFIAYEVLIYLVAGML